MQCSPPCYANKIFYQDVENAGIHSGDACLILPPQDLDPETVRRIEEATRKIGDALNVTGPFNIQFIAKDNKIKVIECNVRASRSFPFVSKVMGLDLIEMATKAMLGLPLVEYPPLTIPAEYVGVKVPQFSFSRLSGADPVLGVEMASTGEVASFGRDKYEAYLKALISSGFRLPNRNILLSIGSFKDKVEILPSIKKLDQLGYKIFATTGTASFLQEHGVAVSYLESLANEVENQKSEYSLTQHLANNLIDLYINLPSNNRFRRPANYLSTGYRTRRMAVDLQVPLVTNVKNAKILIEAISRHYALEIISIDSQTSHRTIQLPGLINVAAFVPGVAARENYDLALVTKASIAAGFCMIRVIPIGTDGSVTDARALKVAQSNSRRGAYCDFNFSVAATSTNADQLSQVTGQVGSLFIPFNHLCGNISKVAAVTSHFESWPSFKPIVTDAKTTDLASLLLLASLHNRKLHVTNVIGGDDIKLLALSKKKGLEVTCDVSIYALFLSQQDFPQSTSLPSSKDQEALWENLATIDVFSTGCLPYHLAISAKEDATPTVGIADAIPLLFTAVSEGRLTIEDIIAKMHHNPKRIFDLHDQDDTSVEVEVDRPYVMQVSSAWSPFAGKTMVGSVKRVMFQGQTACLDGELAGDGPRGADMSSHMPAPISPEVKPVFSPQLQARSDSPSDRRHSLLGTHPYPSIRSRANDTHPLAHSASQDQATEPLPPPLYPTPTLPSSVLQLLNNSPFKQHHILSVTQFTRQDLHLLFTVAQEMRLGVQRHGVLDLLRGRLLCTLFYEPSTRTSASFDAAMQRLGGRVVAIATSQSSTQKGESLQDTIRTLACYGDAIVLRHPDPDSAATAAKYSPVPVINGGNGSVEHPTQAFLDLFTIREELGTVTGLTITFAGDLKNGRTVHSLVQLLAHYSVQIQLVAPSSLVLPDSIKQDLVSRGQLLAEAQTLEPGIVARSDVLYCTRVQRERFTGGEFGDGREEYERVKGYLRVDSGVMRGAKQGMVVMHPLPRTGEVDGEVDFDQRAAYFRQVS